MHDSALVDLYSARSKARGFAAQPLAQLAAAFALGILAQRYFVVPQFLLLLIAASIILIALTALAKNQTGFATVLVILAALLLGSSLAAIEKGKLPPNQLR